MGGEQCKCGHAENRHTAKTHMFSHGLAPCRDCSCGNLNLAVPVPDARETRERGDREPYTLDEMYELVAEMCADGWISGHGPKPQERLKWLRESLDVMRSATPSVAPEVSEAATRLTEAEDRAMKALLDTHHCGSGEEDKYCGGCVALAWDLVRASRATPPAQGETT